MHSHPVLPSLAVDEASIHQNDGKVKQKMQKSSKFFQVLRLAVAGAGDYTFRGYTFSTDCHTSKNI